MADRTESDAQVELSSNSNGHNSQTNLVGGRARPKKSRRNENAQTESSMTTESNGRHEPGNFKIKFN